MSRLPMVVVPARGAITRLPGVAGEHPPQPGWKLPTNLMTDAGTVGTGADAPAPPPPQPLIAKHREHRAAAPCRENFVNMECSPSTSFAHTQFDWIAAWFSDPMAPERHSLRESAIQQRGVHKASRPKSGYVRQDLIRFHRAVLLCGMDPKTEGVGRAVRGPLYHIRKAGCCLLPNG